MDGIGRVLRYNGGDRMSKPMDLAWRLLKEVPPDWMAHYPTEAMSLPIGELEGVSMGSAEAMTSHPNWELFQEAGHPEHRIEEFFGPEIAEIFRRSRAFEDEWGFREQEEEDQLREMGMYEEPITIETQDKLDFAPDVFMEHQRHNIENLPSGGHRHEMVPTFGNVNIRPPAPIDEYQYGAKVGPDMQKYPLLDMEEQRFSPWQTDSEYGNLRNTRQGGFSTQDQLKWASEPMDLAFRLLKQQSPHSITSRRARIRELYPQGIHGPRSRPITDEERAAWEAEDAKECPDCSGLGFVEQMVPDPEEPGEMMWDTLPCTTCNGTGGIA